MLKKQRQTAVKIEFLHKFYKPFTISHKVSFCKAMCLNSSQVTEL